jgi:uncharacterized protein YhdP
VREVFAETADAFRHEAQEQRDAYDSWQESVKEVQRTIVEGAYVSFRNQIGYDYAVGHGTVEKITAKTYIVLIDRANTSWRIEGDRARINVDNAFRRPRYLRLEWGPTGNAERAAVQRAKAEADRLERERRAKAEEAMRAALAAYDSVVTDWQQHESSLERVQRLAHDRALVNLLDMYEEVWKDLLHSSREAVAEESGVDLHRERPALLDTERPSNRWRDYLTEEEG